MTREETVEYAIKFFNRRLREPVLQYGERQAIHIAISALREQEGRNNGCKFCCYTEFPDKKLCPKENDGFDFYAGAWKRVADDDFIEAETDHIWFCPMCGRRLEGE